MLLKVLNPNSCSMLAQRKEDNFVLDKELAHTPCLVVCLYHCILVSV